MNKLLVLSLYLVCFAPSLQALELSGAITYCHDPSTIIYADGKYWCFSTNNNLNCRYSTNLRTWSWASQPFTYSDGVPAYMTTYLSTCEGTGPWNLWAPDIIKYGDLYYLYYSRDMCGGTTGVEETTVCGLVISSSITNRDWVDQGPVLLSNLSADYRRNIDPTLMFDPSGNLWMAVGSYGSPDGNGWTYGGIWLYQMDKETGMIKSGTAPTQLARAWIEAPCLYYKNGYYYLFFNQQSCCVGTASKYYIRYGRSTTINGTYYDKEGVSLRTQNTGGSLFLGRDYFANYDSSTDTAYDYLGSVDREIGPGHFAYFTAQDGVERFSFHFYDNDNSGIDTLAIRTLIWGDDGWPRAGWELADGTYAVTCGMNRDSGAPAGGLFMEIPNTSSDIPQLWSWNGGACQIWSFTRVAANQYKITCQGTGKALGVSSGVAKLATYSGSSTQKWYVEQVNNRAFKIVNVSSGLALHVYNSNNTAGASMSVGAWNTAQANNQCFWLTPVGIYNICNSYGGLAAYVANNSTSTRLMTTAWTGDNYQKWRFVPTYDGYTRIVNVGSGLVADLKNGSASDGAYIQQYSNLDNDAQRWGIERLSDNSFRILNKENGKAWMVTASTSGAYINQKRWLHTLDQQWTFIQLSALPYVRTWTGGGTTGNWSDAANWDIPSYAPDFLYFSGMVGLASNNDLTAGQQLGGIKFLSSAGDFTITGNRIDLLGDVSDLSANLQTLNLPIELVDTRTYLFAIETGEMIIGKIISGAGGLEKSGTGVLTLSSVCTYTGTTTVSAGTLKIGTDDAMPSATDLTIATGATLDLNGFDITVTSLNNLGNLINSSGCRAVLTVTDSSLRYVFAGSGQEDLLALAEQWLQTSCTSPDWCDGSDRDKDSSVNLIDLELLSSHWLECE